MRPHNKVFVFVVSAVFVFSTAAWVSKRNENFAELDKKAKIKAAKLLEKKVCAYE